MPKPFALLRAGFPYIKTIGTKRLTDQPGDIAFGQESRIYAITWAPIKILNEAEEDLGNLGIRRPGEDALALGVKIEDGQLVWPSQILCDRDEILYVSDEATSYISMFHIDRGFLGKWGGPGFGDGQFSRPSGLAFDADENIYVADTLNHRVQKLTKNGGFIMSFGELGDGDGQLNMPWGIAVDKDEHVYVADWRNDRIQKFTPDGQFVFQFGKSGVEDGHLNRPSAIAVDKDFDVYVVDTGPRVQGAQDDISGRVQLFSADGRYVQKFLGDATISKSARKLMFTNLRQLRLREMTNLEQEKYFRRPKSVRVDDQGRMWVVDTGAYRIQVYQKEAYPLLEAQIGPVLQAPTLSDN